MEIASFNEEVFQHFIASRTPVCMWGPPGVGKSARVFAMVREPVIEDGEVVTRGVRVMALLVSTRSPSDLVGVLYVEMGDLLVSTPDYLKQIREWDENGYDSILFFDELNTAPPMVQAPALRICAERMVGNHPLPDSCSILAAVNPPEISGGSMTPAMLNRFVHLELNGSDFPAWLEKQDGMAAPIIRGFLQNNPRLTVLLADENCPSAASPRVWTRYVGPLLVSYQKKTLTGSAFAAGCSAALGPEVGAVFAGWVIQNIDNLYENALNNPSGTFRGRPDRCVIFAGMVSALDLEERKRSSRPIIAALKEAVGVNKSVVGIIGKAFGTQDEVFGQWIKDEMTNQYSSIKQYM